MPSYTRGKLREVLTFVQIEPNIQIYYAFKTKDFSSLTNVSAEDISALGHLTVDQLPGQAITYYRANSPKPLRVKKRLVRNPSFAQQGSAQTYCAKATLGDAQALGWSLVKGVRYSSLTQNARTVTALAKLSNGVYYAFPMNAKDFEDYSEELGLESPATASLNTKTERLSVVRGSSYPKAGQCTKELSGSGTISTFYSTSKQTEARAAGWSIESEEIIA